VALPLRKSNRRRIVDAEALQQSHHRVAALHPVFAQEALAARRRRQWGQGELLHHLLPRKASSKRRR
jgi:hypothetical protein